MRAMMAGLLGLCLCLGTPLAAEARSDTRAGAQNQAPRAAAARPPASAPRAAVRPATARPITARPVTARPADTRQASLRPAIYRTTTATPARDARNRARAAVPYASRQTTGAAPQQLRRTTAAACTTRQGRRVCGPRDTSLRWTGGLAPAAMSQASCPDGTMATNAIGHSNVVRCVPL
jgi:hypothetical protein